MGQRRDATFAEVDPPATGPTTDLHVCPLEGLAVLDFAVIVAGVEQGACSPIGAWT